VGEVPVVENENLYLGVSRDRSQILLDEWYQHPQWSQPECSRLCLHIGIFGVRNK
jgi:hypothetical protein